MVENQRKLLYIGHSYHNKTKSSQFIQDLFSDAYEVIKFDFDPYKDYNSKFNELKGQKFDIVVLFQIMPSIGNLKKIVSYDHIAFFPMYDGVPPLTDNRWYEYKDCNIINFSKTLHENCKKCGLSSYYIQYFPKPKEISDWGDDKSVFLWQRISKINPITVDKVIGFENINKFYHHQAIDPEQEMVSAPQKWEDKVEVSSWFETKEEMEKHLQKSAIYFAPRRKEGIGMSFLDAMAMGRCVIAPNDPTMNEYIQNGYNGYLYNFKNPKKIKLLNLRETQQNTVKFIKNGYEKWGKEKYQIFDWIESDVTQNRDNKLIEKKLKHYKIQKKKLKIHITYLTKEKRNTHDIYYLFGILPIFIKRKKRKDV